MNDQVETACTRKEVLEKVIACIVGVVDNPKYKVEADTSLTDELGFDSLEVVELAMQLEEDFGIEIPDNLLDGFNDANSITNVVIKLKRNL